MQKQSNDGTLLVHQLVSVLAIRRVQWNVHGKRSLQAGMFIQQSGQIDGLLAQTLGRHEGTIVVDGHQKMRVQCGQIEFGVAIELDAHIVVVAKGQIGGGGGGGGQRGERGDGIGFGRSQRSLIFLMMVNQSDGGRLVKGVASGPRRSNAHLDVGVHGNCKRMNQNQLKFDKSKTHDSSS